MSPEEAKAFLASLAPFGMRFGLERMEAVLAALGHPERLPRVLHVAGTNGKGSTCAFAASMLRAAGLKVGLYTSPHLVEVNERIRIDGAPISDEAFARCASELLARFPDAKSENDPLTYFEFGTALALLAFSRGNVDAVVLETGLGGRLDATNAVPAKVTAITRIALDHTSVLGPTLEAVAAEKAGIFKPGAEAILGRQPPEAGGVLRARAEAFAGGARIAGSDFRLEPEAGGRFVFESGETRLTGLTLSLLGPHQRENAEVAIEAVRRLVPGIGEAAIREGLASAEWPGRLERVRTSPDVLLDGAHNPDGAQALARALRTLYPETPVHLVFGALADKDVAGIVEALLPGCASVELCAPANERALSVESLAELARARHRRVRTHPGLQEAIDDATEEARSSGGLVLVAGSLYLVGEARRLLVR